MELLSGVELFGLLEFGVDVDDGLVVLFGLVVSVLLELVVSVLLELELGDVDVELLLLLEGEVEFMSELLLLDEDGEVVDDGEVEELDPVWLVEVDGVLWELVAPLPAPLASLLPLVLLLLCAMAIPVEKMTAVAIVRSFLLMRSVLLSAG